MLRKGLHLFLLEGADHESREEPGEDDRRVPVRLAPGQLELSRRQEQRHSAQLGDPDLERHARAGRGLVEDQPDRPAGQDAELPTSRALGLELVGEIEQGRELVLRPAGDAGEASPFEVLWYAWHSGDATAAII